MHNSINSNPIRSRFSIANDMADDDDEPIEITPSTTTADAFGWRSSAIAPIWRPNQQQQQAQGGGGFLSAVEQKQANARGTTNTNMASIAAATATSKARAAENAMRIRPATTGKKKSVVTVTGDYSNARTNDNKGNSPSDESANHQQQQQHRSSIVPPAAVEPIAPRRSALESYLLKQSRLGDLHKHLATNVIRQLHGDVLKKAARGAHHGGGDGKGGFSKGRASTASSSSKSNGEYVSVFKWVNDRKQEMPPDFRIPRQADRDGQWYWLLIKSFVTRRDCITGYVPNTSKLRTDNYYKPLKKDGGAKPEMPEPSLIDPSSGKIAAKIRSAPKDINQLLSTVRYTTITTRHTTAAMGPGATSSSATPPRTTTTPPPSGHDTFGGLDDGAFSPPLNGNRGGGERGELFSRPQSSSSSLMPPRPKSSMSGMLSNGTIASTNTSAALAFLDRRKQRGRPQSSSDFPNSSGGAGGAKSLSSVGGADNNSSLSHPRAQSASLARSHPFVRNDTLTIFDLEDEKARYKSRLQAFGGAKSGGAGAGGKKMLPTYLTRGTTPKFSLKNVTSRINMDTTNASNTVPSTQRRSASSSSESDEEKSSGDEEVYYDPITQTTKTRIKKVRAPNCADMLFSLQAYQQELEDYYRTEWTPPVKKDKATLEAEAFYAKHVKKRAKLLGYVSEEDEKNKKNNKRNDDSSSDDDFFERHVGFGQIKANSPANHFSGNSNTTTTNAEGIDAVANSTIARIGSPGKRTEREAQIIREELNRVSEFLNDESHIPVDNRPFLTGDEKRKRMAKYGLRVVEGLFQPTNVPHYERFEGKPKPKQTVTVANAMLADSPSQQTQQQPSLITSNEGDQSTMSVFAPSLPPQPQLFAGVGNRLPLHSEKNSTSITSANFSPPREHPHDTFDDAKHKEKLKHMLSPAGRADHPLSASASASSSPSAKKDKSVASPFVFGNSGSSKTDPSSQHHRSHIDRRIGDDDGRWADEFRTSAKIDYNVESRYRTQPDYYYYLDEEGRRRKGDSDDNDNGSRGKVRAPPRYEAPPLKLLDYSFMGLRSWFELMQKLPRSLPAVMNVKETPEPPSITFMNDPMVEGGDKDDSQNGTTGSGAGGAVGDQKKKNADKQALVSGAIPNTHVMTVPPSYPPPTCYKNGLKAIELNYLERRERQGLCDLSSIAAAEQSGDDAAKPPTQITGGGNSRPGTASVIQPGANGKKKIINNMARALANRRLRRLGPQALKGGKAHLVNGGPTTAVHTEFGVAKSEYTTVVAKGEKYCFSDNQNPNIYAGYNLSWGSNSVNGASSPTTTNNNNNTNQAKGKGRSMSQPANSDGTTTNSNIMTPYDAEQRALRKSFIVAQANGPTSRLGGSMGGWGTAASAIAMNARSASAARRQSAAANGGRNNTASQHANAALRNAFLFQALLEEDMSSTQSMRKFAAHPVAGPLLKLALGRYGVPLLLEDEAVTLLEERGLIRDVATINRAEEREWEEAIETRLEKEEEERLRKLYEEKERKELEAEWREMAAMRAAKAAAANNQMSGSPSRSFRKNGNTISASPSDGGDESPNSGSPITSPRSPREFLRGAKTQQKLLKAMLGQKAAEANDKRLGTNATVRELFSLFNGGAEQQSPTSPRVHSGGGGQDQLLHRCSSSAMFIRARRATNPQIKSYRPIRLESTSNSRTSIGSRKLQMGAYGAAALVGHQQQTAATTTGGSAVDGAGSHTLISHGALVEQQKSLVLVQPFSDVAIVNLSHNRLGDTQAGSPFVEQLELKEAMRVASEQHAAQQKLREDAQEKVKQMKRLGGFSVDVASPASPSASTSGDGGGANHDRATSPTKGATASKGDGAYMTPAEAVAARTDHAIATIKAEIENLNKRCDSGSQDKSITAALSAGIPTRTSRSQRKRKEKKEGGGGGDGDGKNGEGRPMRRQSNSPSGGKANRDDSSGSDSDDSSGGAGGGGVPRKATDDEYLIETARVEGDVGCMSCAAAFLLQRVSNLDAISTIDLSCNLCEEFPVKLLHYELKGVASIGFHGNKISSFRPIIALALGIVPDSHIPGTLLKERERYFEAKRERRQQQQLTKMTAHNHNGTSNKNGGGMGVSFAADSFLGIRGNSLDTASFGVASGQEFGSASPAFWFRPHMEKLALCCDKKKAGGHTHHHTASSTAAAAVMALRGRVDDGDGCAVDSIVNESFEAIVAAFNNTPADKLFPFRQEPLSECFAIAAGGVTSAITGKTRSASSVSSIFGGHPSSTPSLLPHGTAYWKPSHASPLQQRLRTLSLNGNPVEMVNPKIYRQKILLLFPNLTTLDNNSVTVVERSMIL